ncbi:5-(carboxyamino)imidazole ribonucleotide synthase [Marinospirillum alkaliphilum]|uniref:N5-carboxyaminoimidazole ribonucleotide synthase n=1 Tax=Marinospirillum alkaliphilum DSM 21637 TaxID=1122209 RepID=A0A1K1V1H9_9GAMM|nr:5-(carboxyamino)imidazole ribonucleotide synthase [Marinospirillum alkaliphilum]SFX18429.1 5-(carboxyamino)imidazole ribonucleotide synthase [Marinospirillum alkaliphilum DSM 21637]
MMTRIGVLGAGQLGQMLALAGYPLGQRFVFLDTSGSPSADIGTTLVDVQGEQLDAFLAQVDSVTYEFEHLPVELVKKIEQHKPVFPSSRALAVCQNRGLEKALFSQLNIPTPEYRLVNTLADLQQAVAELGQQGQRAVVAKTVTEGYDGKGQAVLRSVEEAEAAWQRIGNRELIVEAFVDFVREVSIIAVRGQDGRAVFYPMAENHHVDGILRYSLAPLPDLSEAVQQQAEQYIQALLNELEYVGVLTLELFQQADGRLLANEMAPRVHNSGHWTQNGAVTSQFENHLRAVAGLPLGATTALAHTCMVNIIGKQGDAAQLLQLEGTHLHLYGKQEREGRKLGHLNLVAADLPGLLQQVTAASQCLPGAPAPVFSFVK